MSEEPKGVASMGEIFQLGHKAVEDLFKDPVEITEKIDGSYFSFSLGKDGELRMRSKGQQLFEDNPSSKMFALGMAAVQARKTLLIPGWIYRGEYLQKPKHNSLAYDRVPYGNVVLFDVEMSPGSHAAHLMRNEIAQNLGFTPVPVLYEGESDPKHAMSLLDNRSCLGVVKIEGVVVKNYSRFIHGKPMMAKYVSAEFKEVHEKEWKKSNPTRKDVVQELIDRYQTGARWQKAIQHLRDEGALTGTPQDIGPLMKEIPADILKEEEEKIKDILFKHFWPEISRGVTRGFPEFYKQLMAEGEFSGLETTE